MRESFFFARGSFDPEIFVSKFFRRQSPGFLALQVEGLLAHIVTVLVTYHTYIITMMATTSSTMMGNNGVADALTTPPLLRNDHDYDGQGGCYFGRAFPHNTKKTQKTAGTWKKRVFAKKPKNQSENQ